ncbi:MAG TPA: pyridoxamine 5'-phosphate oxidase [Verrucomicrobiae bacterium]|jgi:pyridoxamine 5'-phosphate oxidase|nr:pyridoxamine 5'-phosphate oxidase [Verrucomicrobiae bacterium]
MSLADIRREYTSGGLRRADLDANPIAQFQKWFAQAETALAKNQLDVNAATLATADKNGIPSARVVLLKGLDERGFTFFTNYGSRKGRELAENPNAALVFYWQELERQVCIAGPVEKTSRAESEKYFKSRPRGSQLAAWASNQSEIVSDRAVLEKKWNEMEMKFPNEILLPSNWGGFILSPQRIEFWQGRASRLHDRFCYSRQANDLWKLERLAP